MFVIKSRIFARIAHQNKNYFSTSNCFYLRSFNHSENTDENKIDENKFKNKEVETLEQIESNLFENNEYKPINTKQILNEVKISTPTLEPKSQSKKPKQKKVNQKNKSEEIIDDKLGFYYNKLKLNDPLIGKIFIDARTKGIKQKNKNNNEIIVEGWRLIREAFECKLELRKLIFSKNENLDPILDLIKQHKNKAEFYKIPPQTLRTWSTLTTCPGVIAFFERKNNYEERENNHSFPITVICDNIREPNNLGSIIRTCAAVPCSEVIVMKGCCDPWETKALRGGCGGQFRIKINDNIIWNDLENLIPPNSSIFIAENNLQKLNEYECKTSNYSDIKISMNHNSLIIGGETEGISNEAYRFFKDRGTLGTCINVPLAKGIDSLNTSSALTLIVFEMRRKIFEMDDEFISMKNNG